MENFLSFLTNNINFLILADSVFLIVMFFAIVANMRQGFKHLDLTPLTYYAFIKYGSVVLESYIYNFRQGLSIWVVVTYLMLNVFAGFFLFVFANRAKALGKTTSLVTISVFFVVVLAVLYFYGLIYAVLIGYSFFVAVCYYLVAFRIFNVLWAGEEAPMGYIAPSIFVVSVIESAVLILGFFYIFQGEFLNLLVVALFVRLIVIVVISSALFITYTNIHRRMSITNAELLDMLYTDRIRLILLLTVLLAIIASFFLIRHFQEEDLNNFVADVDTHLDTSAGVFRERVDLARGVVVSFARSSIFDNGMAHGPALAEEIDREAKTMKNIILYVMDTSGNVIDSSNRDATDSFVGDNYSFRPYFIEALNGKAGEEHDYAAIGVTSKIAGYYLANPIDDSRGTRIGVAVIKVNLFDIPGAEANSGGCYFISDNEHIVIYSKCKDKIFNTVLPVSEDTIRKKIASEQYPYINNEYLASGLNKKYYDSEADIMYKDKESLVLLKQVDNLLFVGFFSDKEKNTNLTFLTFLVAEIIAFFSLVLFFTRVFDHQTSESIAFRERDALLAKKEAESEKKELERMNSFMIGREIRMVELKKQVKELEDKLRNK
ncbi:MAG TPA: hypothetical protein P5056_01770 [Candidatus Paceibacterota bacterium]|nr:hypothetical protein [Candidatus Paceibacterota bacterium]